MSWQSAYDREMARAFFLMRGTSSPDLPEEEIDEEGISDFLTILIAQNLALFLIQLERRFPTGEIQDVNGLIQLVRTDYSQLSLRLEAAGRSAVNRSVNIARDAHTRAVGAAAREAGVPVSFALEGFQEAVQRKVEQRVGFRSSISQAVRRNVVQAANAADELIRAAADQRGQDVAQALVQHVVGRDNRAIGMYRDLGGRYKEVGQGIGRLKAGLGMFEGASRLPSDVKRNIIHGVNTIHHEAMVHAYAESPIVERLKFNNSGRHLGLNSSPDACTLLARANAHGLGVGVYYPETCVSLVHPWCSCFITPIYRDPSKWSQPKATPRSPDRIGAFISGTDNRDAALANSNLQRAYQDWEKARRERRAA